MLDGRRRSKAVAGSRNRFLLERLREIVLRITGMPDYEAYVRHVRSCHPGGSVPTERQFFDEYLKARYEGGPTRCC